MGKSIYSIFLLIMLVSCTSELEVLDTNSQEQSSLVHFSISVDDLSDAPTRAAIEGQYLPDNSQVGLYALTEKENDGEYDIENDVWNDSHIRTNFDNACYKFVEETNPYDHSDVTREFVPDEGTRRGSYPSGDGMGLRLFAYYPYKDNSNIRKDYYGVPMVRVENEFETDFMYSEGKHSTEADKAINLTLHHAKALVKIFVIGSNQDWKTDSESPLLKSVEVETLSQKGYMYIDTGKFRMGDNADSANSQYSKTCNQKILNRQDFNGQEPVASFMVFPHNGNGEDDETIRQITLNIDDKLDTVYSYSSSSSSQNIKIKKGKITNVYIKFNK